VKGLVLAAGLGTRLRPLTTLYPKPLIPFLGSSPLEIALGRLAKAGIKQVAVNSHYLPEQIAAVLERNPFGQELALSHEEVLLGTGGVYNPLRKWLGSDDLFVYTGDIVADVDVAKVAAYHRQGGFVATMALLPSVVPGESGVHEKEGRVVAIGKEPVAGATARNFACVQVLSPAFLELLPKNGTFDVIRMGYQVAFEKGLPVGGIVHDGMWHDIRDPQFYWLALKDVMARAGMRNFVARGAQIAAGASIGENVVVEHGAKVEAGARLESCVVLPGVTVQKDQSLVQAIVLPADYPAISLSR
jgi:NDP-sugar pyrophosphorylase family protein